ncbi:MAG TPA: phosphoglucosamine mutase [Armatimonadota bacterium]|nr:phosphoglucosamine mutase [Armatimonadota bacterium]HPO74834.1 phosphoglucosamine mutase [Armatimonadota bacterium]
MTRFFGTDGLRGRANVDLTPELAVRVGLAAGFVLGEGEPGILILGRDTRESGTMLEAAVASGLASAGWNVRLAGVMTSPGVAYLTNLLGADAGCVISASHNPAPDNGIKFFTAEGAKLVPAVEEQIEALLDPEVLAHQERPRPGWIRPLKDAGRRYTEALAEEVRADLTGLRIVVDCANGAASRLAPGLFARLGAEVIPLCHQPDGRNINAGCGATHPERLASTVLREGADAGVAFDGDADRAIFVDHEGQVRNGDHVLYIIGTQRRAQGKLPGDLVVGTVMSNLGAERALAAQGIRLERTRVGDREVFARMCETGAVLGGEQSGHIIFRDRLNTGDGILTALEVFTAVRKAGKPLAELAAPVELYPQLLINIPLRPGLEWQDSSPLGQALKEVKALVEPEGRIVVRPSGTEPLLRVMIETPHQELLDQASQRIQTADDFPGLTCTLLSPAG